MHELVPIPALLATSGVHHHLIREETRTRCGLIVESGEAARSAAFRPADWLRRRRGQSVPGLRHAASRCRPRVISPTSYTFEKLEKNYIKAVGKGLLKVMSQDGHLDAAELSRGADFRGHRPERRFCRRVFHLDRQPHPRHRDSRPWPKNRCAGTSMPIRATDVPQTLDLDVGGQYQWRRKGEAHLFNPEVSPSCSSRRTLNSREEFRRFCQLIDEQQRQLLTLRGLLEFKQAGTSDPAGRSRTGQGNRQAVSPPARCRTARSRAKRTKRWRSP